MKTFKLRWKHRTQHICNWYRNCSGWNGSHASIFSNAILRSYSSLVLRRTNVFRLSQYHVDLSHIWFADAVHTEFFSRNFIKSNRNQIIYTIFWLIWNQKEPDQSENSKYNLISVWFNKISRKFFCVRLIVVFVLQSGGTYLL